MNTEKPQPMPAGRKERIRERLILPFSLLMMLILLLGLYGGYRLQQYHLNAEVDAKMAGVDTLFTQFLADEAKFMEAQLDFLVKDKEILAATVMSSPATPCSGQRLPAARLTALSLVRWGPLRCGWCVPGKLTAS